MTQQMVQGPVISKMAEVAVASRVTPALDEGFFGEGGDDTTGQQS